MIPVVVIQGPTAIGKSSLAMQLAKAFQTEIISADSRQVYKFLDIGTAKPSREERENIVHHLVDIITPDEKYSAGEFCKIASQLIEKLHRQNKLPLVCGGTMFYLKALQDGIFQAPTIPDHIRNKLREVAEIKGSEYLHEKLKKIDPDSAARANSKDANRIIRALEVFEYTGKTITQLWKENPPPKNNFRFFNILLQEDRKKLYHRINQRVDEMVKSGLMDEFQNLIKMGYNEKSPGLNTLGYKELFACLHNEKQFFECVEEIKQHTRNYAKRQLTWYRRTLFDLTLPVSDITFYPIVERIKKFVESEQE